MGGYNDPRPGTKRPLNDIVSPATRIIAPRERGGSSDSGAIGGSGSFKGARVFGTSTQTLTTGVDAFVTWSTEDYDTAGFWAVGQPTRLTIPVTGYYSVFAKVYYVFNATGSRWATIFKNNTTIRGEQSQMAITTASYQTLVSTAIEDLLVAGDYLELRVHQNSGGNLNIERGASFFGISLLAAL
jgi:hypothetical protein